MLPRRTQCRVRPPSQLQPNRLIDSLSLINFRNYESASSAFVAKLNFFTGLNGSGKTNLLDALYYTCVTKSANTSSDRHVVRKGTDFFRLEAKLRRHDGAHEVVAKVQPGKLKVFEIDGGALSKLSEHIGYQPVIYLAPGDQVLVEGGSADRRRFVDFYLSQTDRAYLSSLMQYNRMLAQRNALLKDYGRSSDLGLLGSYAERMAPHHDLICSRRSEFISSLDPIVAQFVDEVSAANDHVQLLYAPDIDLNSATLVSVLSGCAEKDMALGRTTRGCHRDDMTFSLEGQPLKRFGSQGQRKSYLIALHLALYQFLATRCDQQPLILLDDIFDKLDDQRVEALVRLLGRSDFGQVFITDARPERVAQVCADLETESRIFEIQTGRITVQHTSSGASNRANDEEE